MSMELLSRLAWDVRTCRCPSKRPEHDERRRGEEGVSGAADWVGAGILAERAGGVRVGVGEAHADGPSAVVETAAGQC